jgi:ubiquitin C-terminal hydrolase
MWSENCIIRPSGFIKKVQEVAKVKDRQVFTGYAQNDLEEFLTFLIECFHNALFREFEMNILGTVQTKQDKLAVKSYNMMKEIYGKEYSEIIDLFYGIHVSNLSTDSKSYQNITPEPFCILSLPIPEMKSPTMLDCFDLYTKKETLSGDNAIYNEKLKKKENATREMLFWTLPKIMICTLKRFTNNSKKNQKYVDFDLNNIDLSKYVVGYDKNMYTYELYGICNHQGSCLGGHYTAFVKNANGKWYFYNDTNVMEVPDITKLKTAKAYCFFYRKKKIQ